MPDKPNWKEQGDGPVIMTVVQILSARENEGALLVRFDTVKAQFALAMTKKQGQQFAKLILEALGEAEDDRTG